MWTQIVGKTRMLLAPMENHWWNATLYVTPNGLTTSAIPYGSLTFEIEFDWIAHQLSVRTSGGVDHRFGLYPRSVADFYREYFACLKSLGIEARINRKPMEFPDTTPFDEDQHHASYDKASVETFRQILIQADRALKVFRGRFIGKCSPVHFFWGSFDLAVTRFSGRRAPERPGADAATREAYSHEVSSCGFWPGDRNFRQPAFYAYSAPSPAGLDREPVSPGSWNTQLGEFILTYDEVREKPSPEALIVNFCQTTYEAGAKLAHWDRAALERPDPSPALASTSRLPGQLT